MKRNRPDNIDVVVSVWSIMASRTRASEVELTAVTSEYGDSGRLLGAISALSTGDKRIAARLFREFADEIEPAKTDSGSKSEARE